MGQILRVAPFHYDCVAYCLYIFRISFQNIYSRTSLIVATAYNYSNKDIRYVKYKVRKFFSLCNSFNTHFRARIVSHNIRVVTLFYHLRNYASMKNLTFQPTHHICVHKLDMVLYVLRFQEQLITIITAKKQFTFYATT